MRMERFVAALENESMVMLVSVDLTMSRRFRGNRILSVSRRVKSEMRFFRFRVQSVVE